MIKDIEKLSEARKTLFQIANGINPVDNSQIRSESFLNDPMVIRSLFTVITYIDEDLAKTSNSDKKPFKISEDQKKQIIFPEGNIGVNDFANAINSVIDTRVVKKVSGAVINKQLKKWGILSEVQNENGNKRTITNEKSEGYGIISELRTFDNRKYEQVLFTEVGKQFLLKNLEKLLES